MDDLKIEYNLLLKRAKKGEAYLDNQEIALEKRDKWIPEFQKIINRMGVILGELGDVSTETVFNGFKFEEAKNENL